MRNLMGSEEHEEEEVESEADQQAEASDDSMELGSKGDEEKASSPVSLPGIGPTSNSPSVLPQLYSGGAAKGHPGYKSAPPSKAFYAGLDPFTHIPLWSVDGELVSKSNIPPGYEVEPQSKRYRFTG